MSIYIISIAQGRGRRKEGGEVVGLGLGHRDGDGPLALLVGGWLLAALKSQNTDAMGLKTRRVGDYSYDSSTSRLRR